MQDVKALGPGNRMVYTVDWTPQDGAARRCAENNPLTLETGVARLTYPESWARIKGFALVDPDAPSPPRIPNHVPKPEEDPKGVCVFRTFIDGADFGNLTLPRAFINRTEFNKVSFCNTDLKESNLCWNNFTDVDFSMVILTGCDARSSMFSNARFLSATLSNADLRHSTFDHCDFTGADMSGTILTHSQRSSLGLSDQQTSHIAWTDDEGEEPDGG